MAQKQVKMEQELDNKEVIKTTSKGWNEESVKGVPVLFAGWQEGKSSHHPISLGLALAAKEKVEEVYIGDFKGVPVIDPLALNQLMQEAFCEKYDIEASKIKVVANHSGAKKELNAIGALAAQTSPEVMARLKEVSPELAEKLTKLSEASAPVEEPAETKTEE